MKLLLIGLGLHLLVLTCNAKDEKNEKELVMLEVESEKPDDRPKRASQQEGLKILRQSPEVPPEYLSLLQQLATQRDQGAAAQQPQYVQQLVLPKDGRQQPPSTRYVLSQDGRLLEESVAYLGQQQQQFAPTPTQFAQFQQRPQAQGRAQATGRPVVSPELAEFSRQQQRLQQEYADAPLRAQITGSAARARQRQGQTPPTPQPPAGPESQGPQVFAQTPQRTDPRLRQSLQSDNPNLVYAAVPSDAQAILQQQLAQLSLANDPEGRQIYTQASRQSILPQQIIYQQPTQQDFSQERVVYQQQPSFPANRQVTATPSQQSQTLAQGLPQQYLIETTRPQAPQYVQQEVAQQIQYIQPGQILPQQTPTTQPKQQYSSTLLQPVTGRTLVDPKSSRSSIFVSRSSSSTPRPVNLGVETESQKVPVVRLPSPTDQRPLTRHELEALVNAGYAVSPVPVSVPESLSSNYLKSKRQQPVVLDGSRNHVVYENHQDGVQYQYSPGSSPSKVKKSVSPSGSDDAKSTQKAVVNENGSVLRYVLAVGGESS